MASMMDEGGKAFFVCEKKNSRPPNIQCILFMQQCVTFCLPLHEHAHVLGGDNIQTTIYNC